MGYVEVTGIITKKVLNDNTGELEPTRFREEIKLKNIKGGFRRMYKTYDTALLEIVKSGKDLEIVLMVRDMFTYQRVETTLPKHVIANKLEVSERKVTDVIGRMTDSGLILRIGTGVYRLNPFMYLPFRADGEMLQEEWTALEKATKD